VDDLTVRPATRDDDEALHALDGTSWDPGTGFPSVQASDRPTFFSVHDDPARTLVAVRGGRLVGYVRTRPPTPLPENAHVWGIEGFAVLPAERGRGVGTALLQALVGHAQQAGARKLSLRVLSTNTRAQAVYERAGFTVEGVLREEFVVDGELVDDVLMARHLPAAAAAPTFPA
jgi:ribosomal protein S18 acetylase RimI-like enzyme